MNESFDGPRGIEHFEDGYDRLLNMLESETKVRIVLITPIAHGTAAAASGCVGAQQGSVLYAHAIRHLGRSGSWR